MSNSPLSMFSNSIIEFKTQEQRLVSNKQGNMEPAILIIPVACWLSQKQRQNRSDRIELPGININAFEVEGRCVEPMILPDRIQAGEWYPCNFSGAKGVLYLMEPINPPYGRMGIGATLEASVGTKILGIFQSGRLVGNG